MCSNENCPKHTTYSGGHFTRRRGKWWCDDCAANLTVFEAGKNLFDFTTTHLNGTPIHVKSLRHMRQLEKQYGVSSVVANNMSSRWNATPPPLPPPKVVGDGSWGRG
jgi:hypothetical protein